MNRKSFSDTCDKLVILIRKYRSLTLENAKNLYTKNNECIFPFAKDRDHDVHEYFLRSGLKFNPLTAMYYYDENVTSNDLRSARKTIPPQASSSRPSTSTTYHRENEKENQPKSNRGQDASVLLKDTCGKMASLIKRFKSLSLKDVKEFYCLENACDFPFDKEKDQDIHSHFLGVEGVKFDAECRMYFYDPIASSKRKANSPPHGAPLKRSCSAPSANEKEEECVPLKKNTERLSRQGKWRSKFQNNERYNKPGSKPWNVKKEGPQTRSKSEHGLQTSDLVQFQNFVLIGDDFLLNFATFENRCKADKDERGALCKGLCVSGLTISKATSILKGLIKPKIDRLLVYLGSFDILNGKELIELMNDFDEFVDVCKSKEIHAVACTLAPFALHGSGKRKEILIGFNKYLRERCQLSVIDVNLYFARAIDSGIEHYQENVRRVSGSSWLLKLWNRPGYSCFKTAIMANLGHALLDKEPTVHALH